MDVNIFFLKWFKHYIHYLTFIIQRVIKWWNVTQINNIAIIDVTVVERFSVISTRENNWRLLKTCEVIPFSLTNYLTRCDSEWHLIKVVVIMKRHNQAGITMFFKKIKFKLLISIYFHFKTSTRQMWSTLIKLGTED